MKRYFIVLLTLLMTLTSFAATPSDKVNVSGLSPLQATQFLDNLKELVKRKHRQKIAALINYPITVYGCNHKKQVISDKTQFIKNYRGIFNMAVIHAILRQKPQQLFYNYQGVMIGSGEVWFDLTGHKQIQIITINHTDCDASKK